MTEPLVVGFDLDMTLIDSRPGIAAAFRALTFQDRAKSRRRVLSEAGIDPDAQPRVLTPITIEDARKNGHTLLDE